MHLYRLGSDPWQRSSAEKDLIVLVDNRLAMSMPFWDANDFLCLVALKEHRHCLVGDDPLLCSGEATVRILHLMLGSLLQKKTGISLKESSGGPQR